MATVLVVYHSMSGNTKAMAEAVAEGAREVDVVDVNIKPGPEAGTQDLLDCDAVALGSPDYFSYMAGGMKDFFDRTYYPTQGELSDTPCGIFGSAGGTADVVIGCLQDMAAKFELSEIAGPVGGSGEPSEGVLRKCRELGRALAEAAS
ncbi:MAG: flavodoxin family protein [Armatimonadota bacterium]